MDSVKKVLKLFNKTVKWKFFFIFLGILFSALLEIMTLGIISPFIALLLDYELVYNNPYLFLAYNHLNLNNVNTFLVILSLSIGGLYLFRGIYLFWFNKQQFQFLATMQADLSNRLIFKLLNFSFVYHSQKNIAESQNVVIHDVTNLFSVITSLIKLMTDILSTLLIILFLLIQSPEITGLILGLGTLCIIIYFGIFRKKILQYGCKIRQARVDMTKAVNQSLGGIKEVKVLSRESFFYDTFVTSSDVFVEAFSNIRSLDNIPKLIVETVCFGGAFLILSLFLGGNIDFTAYIPELSIFVLAAFRILPSITRTSTYINAILYNRVSIDTIYRTLLVEKDPATLYLSDTDKLDPPSDHLEDIIIRDLSFSYPDTDISVLSNVSFTIPAKKSVAFVGASGSGKTTLLDVILGINTPTTGGVFYQNKSVHHHFEHWSKHIGYIPQQVYLLDETIRDNVAFGIPREQINEPRILRALEQAQLFDFVGTLPNGLDTIIGDRGVRLSGGQRQRLGIARAIYHDPPILVLDEATSALDNDTEKAVMEALIGFQGSKTILIIAHRLTTIEHCDLIFRVENGTVTKE